ncbi:MAG TPA: hypothetical protein VHG88_05730 [Burkholderiales bacterium]|nr:hypothetical protein [Burkholderiales bacterium]
MQDSSRSVARALGAVDDAAELLKLAESAVERARSEVGGDALGVADRLSDQIRFLRKVASLLRHEIERGERRRKALAPGAPAEIVHKTDPL